CHSPGRAPCTPPVPHATPLLPRPGDPCPTVHWPAVVRVGERQVAPLSPASGCSARRRLPSRGALGPPCPPCLGPLRRDDCHLPVSGRFARRSRPQPLPAA